MTRLGSFDDFDGRIWLNTAHQGALPLAAAAEAQEAIAWKVSPHHLTQERFAGVPARLRRALATLLNADTEEIVLANSASYGLHLLANSYPWRKDDEIVVMAGDFPSDLLPWLLAERLHHVRVVKIRPKNVVVSPDELRAAISPRTRMFCTTWVHSFSGHAVDLAKLGEVCRANGVHFVVNASQALGARPLDVRQAPIDALVSVGFKWLCGPYGTGFCWLHPRLLERLQPQKAYWLSQLTADDLETVADPVLPDIWSASDLDVFGTANFFNFKPWAAAVEELNGIGLAAIRAHNDALVSLFLDAMDRNRYRVSSPMEVGERRSTLIFVRHREGKRTAQIHRALASMNINVAFRAGCLRIAPHLYNNDSDVLRAAEELNRQAR